MTTRDQAISVLEELAVLLELTGENTFKVRAYQSAARTLDAETRELGELIATGELTRLKGFGEAITGKLTVLHETGRLPYLEDLRAQVPSGLLGMLAVQGLGPKKVRALWKELEPAFRLFEEAKKPAAFSVGAGGAYRVKEPKRP